MEKRINVAIIGTGFGSLVHLPGYLLSHKYNAVGLHGRTDEKTIQIAKKYNIQGYNSYDDVIEDPQVDLVSIASIPYEHFTMAEKAILKKKHVILEKPMAMNSDQSLILFNLAIQNQIFHAIAHEHRFDPAKQYAKQLLDEEVYGELRSIEIIKHMTYWNDTYNGRNYDWFADKELGGGMIGAHLSHQIDFLNYIGGGPIRHISGRAYVEVKRRFCKITNTIRDHTSEDTVYAIAETCNGKPAFINISASRREDVSQIKMFTDKAELIITGQNNIKILNMKGNVICDTVPEKFLIHDYKRDYRLNTFVYLLDKFYLNYYEGIKQQITTFEDGHNIQLMLDKIEYIPF